MSQNDRRMTKAMMTKVINIVHVGSTSWLSSVLNMNLEVCSYDDRNGVNDMNVDDSIFACKNFLVHLVIFIMTIFHCPTRWLAQLKGQSASRFAKLHNCKDPNTF